MWMTGFDAPSCSTIYLDRPMRNHTLMQTIARANRVFPEKENGLIVDYIGVFRDLEKALAIYGAATGDDRRRLADPGQGGARRRARRRRSRRAPSCASATTSTSTSCAPRPGSSSSRCATPRSRRCSSTTRCATAFLAAARRARKLFKAVLPDPVAAVACRRRSR